MSLDVHDEIRKICPSDAGVAHVSSFSGPEFIADPRFARASTLPLFSFVIRQMRIASHGNAP
jgi:hypothetical protein